MKILDKEIDNVIKGVVATGFVEYQNALDDLIPLINKTEFQRKLQDKKFYEKLQRDIEDGCVMPPITIAFVETSITIDSPLKEIAKFVSENIQNSFVLDGIQRLNTLSRLVNSAKLEREKKLYVNYIFCDSVDKLLYRMITLNNGQRPMTPRHQVEVMLSNVYDFSDFNIRIQTEKERSNRVDLKSFNKSDLIQAYLAFMANSPIIDNKKIIRDKMDSLLVGKIISTDPLEYTSKFEDVLNALAKFQENPKSLKWLKTANNLVGFAVGMKKSSKEVLDSTVDEFVNSIETFDSAFSDFNPSKIKVGKYRRELSCEYFRNYKDFKDYDSDSLLEYFSEITND